MKAVLCTRLGDADDLELHDIPQPEPGPSEVLVKVAAAALNFFDTLVIAGKYQTKPPLPFSPAAEFAGTVAHVGPGADRFRPGERVMGFIGYGAARDYAIAKESELVALPAALDFDRAAGLSVTYGTTMHALKDRARLAAGETLVVLGAAGGTGLTAIEIGKLMGARVIACASSAEKCAFAKAHGADMTIDYAREDLRARLKELGGTDGIDVVYDTVGGPYAEPALRALAWQGRYLVIGFASGEIPKIALNLALLKGCDIIGVNWPGFVARAPQRHNANMADILRWCVAGRLSAHVHATYSLGETARALKDIAARKVMGKAILKP